jgi:Concanavalin A-like lectin/glucanases superfamily
MHRGLLRLVIAVVTLGMGAATLEGVAAADSSSPVVELHLDSLGSGTTPDASPNHLGVTAQGTLIADGRFDHALRMSSAGDSVDVASDPALAPADVTVVAWVRQSGYGFDQFLVGKPYPAGGCNTDSYALTSGLSTGVRFIVDVDGAQGHRQYSTPESATSSVWDGQWHAIAGTYDGSTLSLYQDGQLVGSTPTDGSPLLYDTNAGDAGLAGLYAGIPSNSNNCAFDQKYSGDIDEIRVYDRALSAQEIAGLGAPGAITPPEITEPPTVLAAPADGLSAGGATLHGTVTPNGSAVSDCHFEYGTSTAYGSSVPCAESVGGGTTGVPVSASVSGLSPDTAYDFKLVATNGLGAASDTGTFTTAIDTSVYHLPLTTITSGPAGFTSVAPTFTFTSITAGATFECAYDGGPFSACDTPLTTYGLAYGAHTFRVRSVSPAGARDPSPALRSFTLGAMSGQASCTAPIPWSYRLVDVFHGGALIVCHPAPPDCPADAECTTTTTASLTDADRYAQWDYQAGGEGQLAFPLVNSQQCWDPEVTAITGAPAICPSTAIGTSIGPVAAYSFCDVIWYGITGAGVPTPIEGRDDQRRLTCHVSYTIVPAPGPPPGVGTVYHPPLTTITSGPSGFTSAEPTFTFASSIAAATFECAFDGAPFTACGSPFSTYALTDGPHTFRVRSVSPAGARDPSPALRSFTLGPTSGHGDCTAAIVWDTRLGAPSDSCVAAVPFCPSGARCTAVESVWLADADVNSLWLVVPLPAWRAGSSFVGQGNYPWGYTCLDHELAVLTGSPQYCPGTVTAIALGPATLDGRCIAVWNGVTGAPVPVRGPDAKRLLTCHVSYTITPAVGLVLSPGIGQVVSVASPSAGILAIAAAGGAAKAARVSGATGAGSVHRRREAPPIAPIRIRVRTATPLRIALKLAPRAAATLRRRRHLSLHLTVRFTPTHGAVVVRHQLLTLVSAACTSRRPKPLRRARPPRIPACRPAARPV